MLQEMLNIIPKTYPSYYGLPHKSWRPHQFETLQWLNESEKPVRIIEALTGSGKTGLITAFGHNRRIMSLVQTKLLQEANYDQIYDWDILFGKDNYECIHPDVEFGTTAGQCIFSDVGMNKCPYSNDCPYLVRKRTVIASDKASLNYAYFLLSQWPKQVPYDILAMDEAHMLSDITLNHAGIEIHDKTRQDWDLPPFPSLPNNNSISMFQKVESREDKTLKWLNLCLLSLNSTWKDLKIKAMSNEPEDLRNLSRCQNMISKFESTIESLMINKDQWYIECNDQLIYYRNRKIPGIIARPLTARYHFPTLFLMKPISVLMSATIGNIDAFTEELGIESNQYNFKSVDSIWSPETRPIYVLDAPRMSRKSTNKDYDKQADVIADAILECPSDWEGVIHVTRINEAPLLADRLARRGLFHRVWIPPTRSGTNIQMQAWEERKQTNPGAIAIAWSWTEGVDLFDERICISAKVPYPSLADPFELARQRLSQAFYLQRAAWKLIQSLGRTRRGETEHYDIDGQKNGLVAIADGNWTRVRNYISEDMLKAIIVK